MADDNIKNLTGAAGGLLEAFGQVATDEVAKANAMKFISSTFNGITSWGSDAIVSLTNNIKGVADGSYTEESLQADLDAYMKEKGLADEAGNVDMNSLDGEKLAGFMVQVGTPLPAQVLAGAIGVDIESTASNIFARLKNLANDAAGIKGKPTDAAPEPELSLGDTIMQAVTTKDYGLLAKKAKSTVTEVTSTLDTFGGLASSFGGDIGNSVGGFIDTIKSLIDKFLPDIGSMLSGLIPGGFSFFGGDDDTQTVPEPTAEEQATLLAQQQEHARKVEAERQAALVRPEALGSSPETTQDEFARVHDDKPSPIEVEQQLIEKNPALENLFKTNI
jgi:hypothetical protein